MKTYAGLITGIILFGALLVRGQDNFQKRYSASGDDVIEWIIPSNDGNLILAGNTNTIDPSGDGLIMKTDPEGNIIWSKTYGGEGLDVIVRIISCSDGGYAAVGYTNSYGQGDRDAWVLRIGEDGIVAWSYTFGTYYFDAARDIIQTRDGGFIVAGHEESFDVAFILDLNSHGELQWKKEFYQDIVIWFNDVYENNDGELFFTGAINHDGFGIHDTFIMEMDTNGNIVNSKYYGSTGNDAFRELFPYNDGFLAIGDSWSWQGNQLGWVAKLNSKLEVEKSVVVGDINANQYLESACFSGNSIFVDIKMTNGQSYIIELDSMLALQKSWKFNPANYAYSSHIMMMQDGIIAFAGSVSGSQTQLKDIYVGRFDSEDPTYDCNTVSHSTFILNVDVEIASLVLDEYINYTEYDHATIESSDIALESKNLCILFPPIVDFSCPESVCANSPVSVTDNTQLGEIYHWYFEGAIPAESDSIDPGIIVYENPGYFSIKLVVSNQDGVDSLTKFITVMPVPDVFLGADTILAIGQELSLDAGPGMDHYLWQDGSTWQTLEVSEDGNYWVIVEKDLCYAADTINVKFVGCTAGFSFPEEVCTNEPVIFTNESEFAETYKWYFEGATPSGSELMDPGPVYYENPGIYTVKLVVSIGSIADSLEKFILVYPDVAFSLGPDTTILLTGSLQFITIGEYDSYLWSTGSTTPYLNLPGTALQIGENLIWLRITNGPCESADSIYVTVIDNTFIPEQGLQDIILYPNPAGDHVRIGGTTAENPCYVSFYNYTGIKVMSLDPSDKSMDISRLKPGIYIVELVYRENIVKRRLIVI